MEKELLEKKKKEAEDRRRVEEEEEQRKAQQQQEGTNLAFNRKRVSYGGGRKMTGAGAGASGDKKSEEASSSSTGGKLRLVGVPEVEEDDIPPPLPGGHGEPVIPKDHEAHEHYRNSLSVHKSRSRSISDVPSEGVVPVIFLSIFLCFVFLRVVGLFCGTPFRHEEC